MGPDTRTTPSQALLATGVVAILRGHTGTHTAAVVAALAAAGVRCVEITLNTPGALKAVRAARAHGDALDVGVGTVLTGSDVDAAAEAGAGYVVSPHTSPAVAARARQLGLCYYPGALTATEVATAWDLGATAVKLFPASLGGPGYLRELRAPLGHIRLLPTGGIRADNAGDFIAAGAFAVGAGGWLVGDALDGGSLVALGDRAHRLLDAVAIARQAAVR